VLLLLPNIHRPAHHEQYVKPIQRRNRLSLIQLDSMHRVAGGGGHIPETPRMLNRNMLKNQNFHRAGHRFLWRKKYFSPDINELPAVS
jgi:hypothetical protein